MIHWAEAIVKKVLHERENVQELEVVIGEIRQSREPDAAEYTARLAMEVNDDSDELKLSYVKQPKTFKAVHFTDVLPELKPGDWVRLNTTAVDLRLGSGGVHFVHSILDIKSSRERQGEASAEPLRDQFSEPSNIHTAPGHIMKLRYTPLQRRVLAAEAPESPYHSIFQEEQHLDGMPVLIGELHSMLPIVVCWLRQQSKLHQSKPLKLAYIMSEGGALPIQFSKHVNRLQELGWINGTVTYGHAYGGDTETVNKFTALIAAKHILNADAAVVTMGPGIVGTGTLLGHSGLEMIEIIHAVTALGGKPYVIPRISFADSRDRHIGMSHHLLYSLSKLTTSPIYLPIPESLKVEIRSTGENPIEGAAMTHAQLQHIHRQIESYELAKKHRIIPVHGLGMLEMKESMEHYGFPIQTMGRQLEQDPFFFAGVCASAHAAWLQLKPNDAEEENPVI